jgi:predicted nucleotidyltransferase
MRRDEAIAILAAHREDLKRYRVKSLALFGSVARDEAGPDSDVDLLVEFDRPVGYFLFFDLKEHLEDLLDAPVDLGTAASLKDGVSAHAAKDMFRVL